MFQSKFASSFYVLGSVMALLLAGPVSAQTANPLLDPNAASGAHFHPQGKPPSAATLQYRDSVKAGLPFEDERDFEEHRRGFLKTPPFTNIMADAGHIAWDMESY